MAGAKINSTSFQFQCKAQKDFTFFLFNHNFFNFPNNYLITFVNLTSTYHSYYAKNAGYNLHQDQIFQSSNKSFLQNRVLQLSKIMTTSCIFRAWNSNFWVVIAHFTAPKPYDCPTRFCNHREQTEVEIDNPLQLSLRISKASYGPVWYEREKSWHLIQQYFVKHLVEGEQTVS